MRAVTFAEPGGPDRLRFGEVPDPLVGPDTVRIRAVGAGVNPVDGKIRAGQLQARGFQYVFPVIPGWDVAGEVESIGPAVRRFSVGDRVMAYARKDTIQWGTYADLVSVVERDVAPVPEAVELVSAAALPLAGLTATQILDATDVGPGTTVLVHGGSGGVGLFAVQLALRRGAQVLATASPDAHQLLLDLGATAVVDRHLVGDALGAAVESALAGQLLDIVLDVGGGAPALDATARLVRDGGRIVSITHVPELAASDATRVQAGYVFARQNGAELAALGRLVADGALRVLVERTYPLADAAAAQRRLEAGGVRGKLVLTP